MTQKMEGCNDLSRPAHLANNYPSFLHGSSSATKARYGQTITLRAIDYSLDKVWKLLFAQAIN